ncbi:MAG: transcription elongation factor GreA [Anaerolineae bacterium]|nr:transcription elongation factor GreA [Anaerolineae bacterium]
MDSSQSNTTYLTAAGKKKLQEELEFLRTVRAEELAKRLHDAIKQGDLSENADYTAAKEEQSFLLGRIQDLERMMRDAVILDDVKIDRSRVSVGSTVTVMEQGDDLKEVYMIVGKAESDPAKGKISNESPLGVALLGKKTGDTVKLQTPGGATAFKIVKVE